MKNKKDLIKKVKEISELLIRKGVMWQELALSLEQNKNNLTMKQMKEQLKPTKEGLFNLLKGDIN